MMTPTDDASETIRVLVVEDNEGDAVLLERALCASSLHVHHVADEAGLVAALVETWDVVLTDYRLAEFDGEKVIELVREADPAARVVVVSGMIGEERAAALMRLGAVDYVSKDNLSRLPAVVAREIDEGRRDRQLTAVRAELAHHSKRVRSLLQAVPDELFVVSTAGVVRAYFSGEEVRLFASDAVGKHVRDVVPSEIAGSLVELIARVGRDRGIGTTELVLGEHRFFDARARFSHDHEVVVAIRDISAHRLLERQMLATQRLEAVGRLASGVAHDFNNIITVVRSYADLIAPAIPDTESQTREDVGVIIDAADRASRLTSQLLAFSRHQVRELQTVDVNHAVTGVQRMLRRLIGEDVRIITELAPLPMRVRVDPAQLDQVLINLAVNARDAMPKGGTLTISTDTATDDERRRWVRLVVADDGQGMDQKTRQHVFEPFFTTKEHRGGTGLGLSTVYGIIRQNRGSIALHTAVGEGTRFTIMLPTADRAPLTSRPPRPAPATLRGRERVVLAEDDIHLRRATRRLLEKHGYECRAYANGVEALAAVGDEDVDVLVTDLVMPEMDGVALSQHVRRRRADLPCVFVSGYADDAIAERGLELGPTDVFLRKPFSRQQLLAKVREALARAKMSQVVAPDA
ncbi:MAG: response regulator [Polyangiaceae bacterium]